MHQPTPTSEYTVGKQFPSAYPSSYIHKHTSSGSPPTSKPGNLRNETLVAERDSKRISEYPATKQQQSGSFNTSNNLPTTKYRYGDPIRRTSIPEDPQNELKAQINSLQKENQELLDKLHQGMEYVSHLEADYKNLQSEKDRLEQLYRELLTREEPFDRSSELARINQELAAELEHLNAESRVAKKHAVRLELENDTLQKENDLLTSKLKQIEHDATVQENYLNQIDELLGENSLLKNQIEELSRLLEAKDKALKEQEFDRDAGNETSMRLLMNNVLLAAEVERLHQILDEIKTAFQAYEIFAFEKDMKIVLLSVELERLSGQKETSTIKPEEILERDMRIMLLAAENDRLKEELRAKTAELLVLKGLKEGHSGDLKKSLDLERDREFADSKIGDLKQRIAALETEKKGLQLESNKYKQEYGNLEIKYDAMEKGYKAILDSLNTMKKSQNHLLSDSQIISQASNEERKALEMKARELWHQKMKLEEMTVLHMAEIERLHGIIQRFTSASQVKRA